MAAMQNLLIQPAPGQPSAPDFRTPSDAHSQPIKMQCGAATGAAVAKQKGYNSFLSAKPAGNPSLWLQIHTMPKRARTESVICARGGGGVACTLSLHRDLDAEAIMHCI